MNIDVREYLRINPISVHELTLSGDGNDCFLYFPQNNEDNTGYEVYTQKKMFRSMCISIFGDILEEDNETGLRFKVTVNGNHVEWDETAKLDEFQFSSYVKRNEWTEYRDEIDESLNYIERGLDKKIFTMMNVGGKNNKQGSVEI